MNSRVLCQGCRLFRESAEMRKVGLGYICNDACMEKVRQRAREKQGRRAANRKKSRGALDTGRRNTLARDGRRCRWCGRSSMIQVHHVLYRSQGGGHEASNLIALCAFHHEMAHSDKKRWQHVLIETIRLTDQGLFLTVPEVEDRLLKGTS